MIHIYGQERPHDEVSIIGSPEDLIILREAINRALNQGSAVGACMSGDGEGYALLVISLTPEQQKTAMLPYTREEFADRRGVPPYKIIGSERYRALVSAAWGELMPPPV